MLVEHLSQYVPKIRSVALVSDLGLLESATRTIVWLFVWVRLEWLRLMPLLSQPKLLFTIARSYD